MHRMLIAFAMLFIATPGIAKDIKHTAAGINITVPDAWKPDTTGPAIHLVAPNDKGYMLLLGIKGSEIEQRFNDIETLLNEVKVTEFQPGEPVEATLNGMPMMTLEGKAKLEGKAIEVGLVFVVPPSGDNALIVLGITEDASNDDVIAKMLMSIKPL